MSSAPTFFAYSPRKIAFQFDETLRKSVDEKGEERNVARFVAIISAGGTDMQGEDLDQDGLDWGYFMKSGFFNWEHQPGPDNVLGYPVDDTLVRTFDAEGNPATQVTGELLLDKPKARETWETMCALQKAGNHRQVGFSIEGPVIRRDPRNSKRVLRALVKAVAICAHPIRDTARVLTLAKSMDALHRELSKGDIGYQTPPDVTGGDAGTLAPLFKQSVDKRLVNETPWRNAIRKRFPALKDKDTDRLAKALVAAYKEQHKLG